MDMSNKAREKVDEMFKNIFSKSEIVLTHSNEIDQSLKKIKDLSSKVANEAQSIASFTEENSAAMEEIMASIDSQDEKMQDLVEDFSELDDMTNKLISFINKD